MKDRVRLLGRRQHKDILVRSQLIHTGTIQRQSLVQAIYCSPMYAYSDVPHKDNH